MIRPHNLAAIVGGLVASAAAGGAFAASDVTVDDTLVFAQSITATVDGTVIFGSMNKPIIYKADPGATKAKPFIHLTGKGAVVTLGVLADRQLERCGPASPSGTPFGTNRPITAPCARSI